MARKRHSDEDVLKLLREIELKLASASIVSQLIGPNAYNERFNGTLRREVLNAEWFITTKQAQIVINHWLRQYNHTRPHQALNMRPPVPETLVEKSPISGPNTGG